MICQKQASELLFLEEVFAIVGALWHGEDLGVLRGLVSLFVLEGLQSKFLLSEFRLVVNLINVYGLMEVVNALVHVSSLIPALSLVAIGTFELSRFLRNKWIRFGLEVLLVGPDFYP